MAYQGNHPLTAEMLGDREVRRILHKHAAVERNLHEMMALKDVDWDGIRALKLRKLELMGELERLKRLKTLH